MGLFGRNDKGSTGDDVVWQDCPGCAGKGYNEVPKVNKDGETVMTNEQCSGCRGQGQVPGGSRS